MVVSSSSSENPEDGKYSKKSAWLAQKENGGFIYNNLKWYQKVLCWIGMFTISILLFVIYLAPKVLENAGEKFSAGQQLAYHTEKDLYYLVISASLRSKLFKWGFDRNGIVIKAVKSITSDNYNNILKQVPESDCEYYYVVYLNELAPYITKPGDKEIQELTIPLLEVAEKIYNLPCKSTLVNKFNRISVYRLTQNYFFHNKDKLPLSKKDKSKYTKLLINNSLSLLEKTNAEDYKIHHEMAGKNQIAYPELMMMTFQNLQDSYQDFGNSLCESEVRKPLLLLGDKVKVTLQYFLENRVLTAEKLKLVTRFVNADVKDTSAKLEKCN